MNITELLVPDLKDTTAIVTGAGRGIGRSIAEALALCGSMVILASRREEDLQAVEKAIRASGGSALPVPTDVSDADSLRALFERIDGEFDGRLDILVNNAGVGLYGNVVDLPVEDLDRMFAVNLRGVFLGCQEALRRMAPVGRGTIINISSVVGLKGYPRQAGYTASKHAVIGLTKSLAVEAQAHNVRVSAICPGGVDTDMVALARPDLDRSILLHPEDVARTVLWMLSLPDRAAVDSIYLRRFGSAPW